MTAGLQEGAAMLLLSHAKAGPPQASLSTLRGREGLKVKQLPPSRKPISGEQGSDIRRCSFVVVLRAVIFANEAAHVDVLGRARPPPVAGAQSRRFYNNNENSVTWRHNHIELILRYDSINDLIR